MKKRAEEEQRMKLKESEEKTRKMEAERIAAAKNDSDSDDLDDLLDDICIHPSMLKKPEPEVTQEDARRASEKFAAAKAEEAKEKRVKEKWFTNSDKNNNRGDEEEEEEDGAFSFYKVPWHCNTCGMNVAGDQVEALLAKTGGAMPSPTAPVKQHEAFLEETKSLLHPGNFQVVITKTAQPIVRANRRCSELPIFDPSGKEGQVMYRTSPDCRKGRLRFFPVQGSDHLGTVPCNKGVEQDPVRADRR